MRAVSSYWASAQLVFDQSMASWKVFVDESFGFPDGFVGFAFSMKVVVIGEVSGGWFRFALDLVGAFALGGSV